MAQQQREWWFKFEYKEWLADSRVRDCSIGTRGFWVDILAIMHERGTPLLARTVAQFARLTGCSEAEAGIAIDELEQFGVADVQRLNNGLVTLVSRRLSRIVKEREQNKLRQQEHRRNADVTPDVTVDVTLLSHDRVRVRERIRDKESECSSEDAQPKAAPTKRGTRLPDQFFLTAEMRAWAHERAPTVDLTLETEKFCNYYRAAAGQKGVKLDWAATWRNWILNAKEYSNGATKPTPSGNGAKRGNAAILADYADYFANLDAIDAENQSGVGDH